MILVLTIVFTAGMLGASVFAYGQNQNNRNYFRNYQMEQQGFNQMYNAHKNTVYDNMENFMGSYSYDEIEQMFDRMMNDYGRRFSYDNNNDVTSSYGYGNGMMNY